MQMLVIIAIVVMMGTVGATAEFQCWNNFDSYWSNFDSCKVSCKC